MGKIFFPMQGEDLFLGIAVYLLGVLFLTALFLVIKYKKTFNLHLYTKIVIFLTAYIIHGGLFFLFYTHICLPIWCSLCVVLWNRPLNTVVINKFYMSIKKNDDWVNSLNKADRHIFSYITEPITLQNDNVSNRLKLVSDMIVSRSKKKRMSEYFPPFSIVSIGVVVPSLYCLLLRVSQYEEFNSLSFALFENYVGLAGLTYIFSLLIKYGCIENTHSRYYGQRIVKYIFCFFVLTLYVATTCIIVGNFQSLL